MNFVQTRRQPLNEANYPVNVLRFPRTFEFYQNYPAPKTFTIPEDYSVVYEDQMQLLATWFCRGTSITHRNKTMTPKPNRITSQWVYKFIPNIPKHYIQLGYTTTEAAYAYGQALIRKCTKASQIPFEDLEHAYHDIMSTFWNSPCKFYSPNKKTYLEVSAEKNTLKDIQDLTYATGEQLAANNNYDDDTLALYARIFGVSIPQYTLRFSHFETEHGYAKTPSISMTSEYNLSYVSEKKGQYGYAGGTYDPLKGTSADTANKSRRKKIKQGIVQTPYALKRDEKPIALHAQGLRAQLAAQVDWCLDYFKRSHDQAILAEGWGYCERCGFYQLSVGCPCHLHPSLEEQELAAVHEAQENLQAFYSSYDNQIHEIAEWANENLPIEDMTEEEILRAVYNYFGAIR